MKSSSRVGESLIFRVARAPKIDPRGAKLRLEAGLEGRVEAKLRWEASLEGQVESKLALESGWTALRVPRRAARGAWRPLWSAKLGLESG